MKLKVMRTLLSFVNEKFDVLNLFADEDSELVVDVENITNLKQHEIEIDESTTVCTSDGTDNDSDRQADYNSEELEVIAKERKRIINCLITRIYIGQ